MLIVELTTFHYTTDCVFVACERQMVTLNGEQQKEASSHHQELAGWPVQKPRFLYQCLHFESSPHLYTPHGSNFKISLYYNIYQAALYESLKWVKRVLSFCESFALKALFVVLAIHAQYVSLTHNTLATAVMIRGTKINQTVY